MAHLKEEGFFLSQQNGLLKLKCWKESNALLYQKARHWFSVGEQEFIKAALSPGNKKKERDKDKQLKTIISVFTEMSRIRVISVAFLAQNHNET